MAAIIIVFFLVYLQEFEITPHSPVCHTFTENALLTLGADCFRAKTNTFAGSRHDKKADLISYVSLASGIESPFPR